MSSVPISGLTYISASESGTASTAITRGRCAAGRVLANLRTDSAADVVVRTTVGLASASTAARRSE